MLQAPGTPVPHWRSFGDGIPLVCLHSNAGTGGQWRALGERLGDRFRLLAPDTYGAGKSPQPPDKRPLTLSDELDLLEPVFAAAGPRFHLLGHSYGGAIALLAALRYPERVQSLVLYEPTLFALLRQADPVHPGLLEIGDVAERGRQAQLAGEPEHAARIFIDYWAGAGALDAMPAAMRASVVQATRHLGHWWHALREERTTLESLGSLTMPVLLMVGRRSRLSALSVAELLAPALPGVRLVSFDDLGHMAPLTHAERVNAVIEGFLIARTACREAA